MMKRASTQSGDLFAPGLLGGCPGEMLPDDVTRGLELLAASRPLWPVHTGTWAEIVDTVKAFAERWDGQARTCAWSTLSLYALHPDAPMARLDAMGAAWLLARS